MLKECPKCGRRLGLIEAAIAKKGALVHHVSQHGQSNCDAVFIIESVDGQQVEMRLATEAEKSGATT